MSIIKSRRKRWTGHLARVEEIRNTYRSEYLKGMYLLEDGGVQMSLREVG
jgi:hypothetical protein